MHRGQKKRNQGTPTACALTARVACSVHLGPGLVMFKERPLSWAQQKKDPRGLVKEKPSLTWNCQEEASLLELTQPAQDRPHK